MDPDLLFQDHDGNLLDRVVRESASVPGLLGRLPPPRCVGGPYTQRVLAGPGLPGPGPAAPIPSRRVAINGGQVPGAAAVAADVNRGDRRIAGPGAPVQADRPGMQEAR